MPNQRQLRDITDNDSYYSSKLLGDLVKKIANKKSKSMIKIIDPCAGRGDLTPKGALAADIKPVKKGIRKVDFLKSSLKDYGIRKKGKIMFVMNPPFSIGDSNSSGWELFLNKAAKLCEGRNGSCIITVCYATKSQMEHIDKIDRHLHIDELHTFDSKSEAHVFVRPNNKTSKVPIIVQVWKWKNSLREYTPLRNYKPSKNIPFSVDGSPERKYYVKIWNSPAKIGEITEKKSVKKRGKKSRMELKSLINGEKTKGSLSDNYNNQLKGASIYALKIKKAHTKKIINWFKKIYKKNIWTNYFNNALSNCSITARLLYFVYENKGKLPTVKDLYGTKIVHHGASTKKNKKTRKKRGGKRRKKTRKKRGGGTGEDVCSICQNGIQNTLNNTHKWRCGTEQCGEFHRDCINGWIRIKVNNWNMPTCPNCRTIIGPDDWTNDVRNAINLNNNEGILETSDGIDLTRLQIIATSYNLQTGRGQQSALPNDQEILIYRDLMRNVVGAAVTWENFTAGHVLGAFHGARASWEADAGDAQETVFSTALNNDIHFLEEEMQNHNLF